MPKKNPWVIKICQYCEAKLVRMKDRVQMTAPGTIKYNGLAWSSAGPKVMPPKKRRKS
jgi:hypothetical protein